MLEFYCHCFSALFSVKYKVCKEGVFAQLSPMPGKHILSENIESYDIHDFSALKDYFGWGFRVSKKGLGVISPGQSVGVLIKSKEGMDFMLGSDDPEGLKKALDLYLNN